MQQAIKAKTNASLYPPPMFWKMDQRVTCDKRPAESTKFLTLEVLSKDPKAEFSKESKALFYKKISAKASNKTRKEKKKDQRNHS